MKTIQHILILMIGLLVLPANALSYETPAYSETHMMHSTSPYMLSKTQPSTGELTLDRPAYVPAMSGDLNPFGVSEPVNAPRRAPEHTNGDKDGPAFPLSDANWFLLLLLALYAACTGYMRYRRESKKRPS